MAFIKKSLIPIVSTLDNEETQVLEYNDGHDACEKCGRKFIKNKNVYKKVCTCSLEKTDSNN